VGGAGLELAAWRGADGEAGGREGGGFGSESASGFSTANGQRMVPKSRSARILAPQRIDPVPWHLKNQSRAPKKLGAGPFDIWLSS
jgi:hypothetical protein